VGVVYSAESAYQKELNKWEKPWRWEPYPTMMYQAVELPDGRILAHDPRQAEDAESFNRTRQLIANSEEEHTRLLEKGYRDTPDEAVELLKSRKRDESTAEAERFYAEARMSEKAQAEAKRRDAEVSDGSHVPELPPEPVQKPTSKVLLCADKKANGQPCTAKAIDRQWCKRHGKNH